MKILVVWYSLHGHTRTVAQQIAKILGADTEELIDLTNRSDITGWSESAYHPDVQLSAKLGELKHNPEDYDLVVIGTPIWDNATPGTPVVMKYVSMFKFRKVAFFATYGANEMHAFQKMEELIGKKPIAKLGIQDRDVQLKRYPEMIREFCKEIKSKAR